MVAAAAVVSSLVKTTRIQEAIARVTLNNTKNRNALSRAMLQQIQETLGVIDADPEIRVIILNASGPVFSSGHDLKEIRANAANNLKNENNKNASLMELCSSVMQTIVRLDKPVIAQVNGVATAAGCQLVASCDLAYASSSATFATPGVDLGLFCSTPAVALGRSIHRKHAMQMLLTGDAISAEEAERIGLVNAVIDNDENLEKTVIEIASRIASKSPRAMATGKALFYEQLELPLDAAYRLASDAMADCMNHDEEAREGIDAFLTKRKPTWGSLQPTSKDL